MNKPPTKSYKPNEVAEMIGCTVETVYRLIKYGKLEAFMIGSRNYRITETAVADFKERMDARNREMRDGEV